MKVLETLKYNDRWIVEVELSSDEASLISTVFSTDVCSTKFIAVDELVRKLMPGILASRLKETENGCRVYMFIDDIWLQSMSPPGITAAETLEYIIQSLDMILGQAVHLARSLEDLKKKMLYPSCIKPEISSKVQLLLEKLPLICIKGRRNETSLLEVMLADSSRPNTILKILIRTDKIPMLITREWYRGMQLRFEGCLTIENGNVYIGNTRFMSGSYYSNDCIILEGSIDFFCRDKLRMGKAEEVKLDELVLEENQKHIIEEWIQLVGENIEVYSIGGKRLYMRGGEPRGDIVQGELCIRIK